MIFIIIILLPTFVSADYFIQMEYGHEDNDFYKTTAIDENGNKKVSLTDKLEI